jgi:cyanophycinase
MKAVLAACGAMLLWAGQSTGSVGPEKGWLVLHGGGIVHDHTADERFVALAGGAKASIVVVMTAADLNLLTPDVLAKYRDWWETAFGAGEVTLVDARTRDEADSETFAEPFRNATGVYVVGGSLTRVVEVYSGTRAEREMKAVVERGGVFGGSSAGAMIQGSFLISASKTPWGEPLPRSRMYLDPARLVGFGLLRNVTVYPHLSARHAERDVAAVVARNPGLVGIGIDEDTAVVLHEDRFEVVGVGKAVFFDANRPAVTLRKGQRFDLRTRTRLPD